MSSVIRIFESQPFKSRVGIDTVLLLRFIYDADLVARLKHVLREAKYTCNIDQPGGWLAECRAWFCEFRAWPLVRRHLLELGYEIVDDRPEYLERQRGSERRGSTSPPRPERNMPVNLPAIVSTWSRELALKYHPDRGGSHEQMKVVNDAVERMRKLTGV